MVAAYRLAHQHAVTLFEADDRLGGHTNTVEVTDKSGCHAVDTGFIVFNDRTYPNFCALMDSLGVRSQETTMSFSVRCDRTGFEYCGGSLNGFFARRRNLVDLRAYGILRDFLRFNREAKSHVSWDPRLTVSQYFAKNRYTSAFRDLYFFPMASAIWSCPGGTIADFPIRFIAEFYDNHGLLSISDHPSWRVICGGSKRYIDAMFSRTDVRVHTSCAVRRVSRCGAGVKLALDDGEATFDHAVLACHSDQCLKIRGEDASPVERDVLQAFPYQQNLATLHTDVSVLPRHRRAWACWNYRVPIQQQQAATVSYNMNMLQGLKSDMVYCVTLNDKGSIDPAKVIAQFNYSHPVFTSRRNQAQARHAELIAADGVSYCGAYWGNGFHEDGVNSALAVVARLNQEHACEVASTKVN